MKSMIVISLITICILLIIDSLQTKMILNQKKEIQHYQTLVTEYQKVLSECLKGLSEASTIITYNKENE